MISEEKPPDPPKGEKPLTASQLLEWYTSHPPELVAQLGAANFVTNVSLAALLEPIAKDIKDIHHEVVNPLAVELLQQLRLESAAAALKKSPIFENHEQWWAYAVTAAAGILVTILAARFVSKLPARLTGAPPGAAADLTPERVEALRRELTDTNPLLQTYADQVRRLPQAKEMTARATAIGKLKNAVANQNNTEVTAAADAIKSLKTALRNFDPKKLPTNHSALKKTADALDKLRGAIERLKVDDVRNATQAFLRLKIVLRNLKPSDIPKSGDMRASARAASSLEGATRRLTGALQPLAPALRGVISSAQTTAGALG
ncbi:MULTISPECIES: hypothetical protein [unclassified Streptomyces]|uniref:hypothetical protein n=1 Tax=unclassified Streptomyces TaxID=2593676 RepID=UPI002E2C2B0E|nr:hypothetical protein [Streptomyces sp. NBC_01439]